MSMEVVWIDSTGSTHEEECDYVEEGDSGVFLYLNPGPEQVGYVPYERLEYAVPAEEEEE